MTSSDTAGAPPRKISSILAELEGPVLVLSTKVGRGMYSLGEAVIERMAARADVHHRAIEDFLPNAALQEDVRRYRLISSRFPWLLHLVYRFPPIYLRKLLRERYVRRTDLGPLASELAELGIRTVLCISHRPAFWTAGLKEELNLDVRLVGLLGEYGPNLGWKYIPWPSMNGFLSPVSMANVGFRPLPHVHFEGIELPARLAFEELRAAPGDPRSVLVVCGSWGQGRVKQVTRKLLDLQLGLRIHAVCGDNESMLRALGRTFAESGHVVPHGQVDSLVPLMAECGCVVTKPGIATLVEGHAARRKLFLLRGMPVAEDNNARHALQHFGAEWFRPDGFQRWLSTALDGDSGFTAS